MLEDPFRQHNDVVMVMFQHTTCCCIVDIGSALHLASHIKIVHWDSHLYIACTAAMIALLRMLGYICTNVLTMQVCCISQISVYQMVETDDIEDILMIYNSNSNYGFI